MRVLHLPESGSSQMSILVRALRDLGVDARGIARSVLKCESVEGIETYPLASLRRSPVRGVLDRVRWYRALARAIRWADLVHWHFAWGTMPFDLDLRYIESLGKPGVIEFWGTDIRAPEAAMRDNPYARQFLLSTNTYVLSSKKSRSRQSRFARHGFDCIVPGPELLDYVYPDLYAKPYASEPALLVGDYEPSYPDPRNAMPLVVHAPSSVGVKGTDAVLKAIERLKGTHRFEFRLMHNVNHSEVLSILRRSDIVLDQFVLGTCGVTSLEAMAFGKPTVCFLKDSVLSRMPPDQALINANQHNLDRVLGGLLADGHERHAAGRRSRSYVERYHDAHRIARGLVDIYTEVLERRRRGSHGNR